MVSGSKEVAFNQDILTDEVKEKEFTLPSGSKNLILMLKISNYTDGNYSLDLGHSPDESNYDTLAQIAAQSADGLFYIRITDSSFHSFKITLTSASVTTGAKIEASLVYTPPRL